MKFGPSSQLSQGIFELGQSVCWEPGENSKSDMQGVTRLSGDLCYKFLCKNGVVGMHASSCTLTFWLCDLVPQFSISVQWTQNSTHFGLLGED